MLQPIPDDVFARQLIQMRIATLDQIEAAQREVIETRATNPTIGLADVVVSRALITQAMRENVEKSILIAQQGGIKQLGPYKILKKLGEGGMGAVYLADDTAVGRKVALKVLPAKHASDLVFLARFRREARATGQLNHANIVTAYTTGEDMGVQYYAMEFCDGESLDAKLKREHVLPWEKALEITIQIARGLKHAHEHHLIHRDIKPANILLTKNGTAKILDLGLSKNIVDTEQSFATQTGAALGTPHYISPEQACGDKILDGRTDIYSLGATLYHLVTGLTPFQGSTPALIMMKHLNEQLPNPRDLNENIPEGVCRLIQKMMAKKADDRYRDCDELLRDLERILEGKSPESQELDAEKSSVAMPGKRGLSSGLTGLTRENKSGREPFFNRKKATVGAALIAAALLIFGATALTKPKIDERKAVVEKQPDAGGLKLPDVPAPHAEAQKIPAKTNPSDTPKSSVTTVHEVVPKAPVPPVVVPPVASKPAEIARTNAPAESPVPTKKAVAVVTPPKDSVHVASPEVKAKPPKALEQKPAAEPAKATTAKFHSLVKGPDLVVLIAGGMRLDLVKVPAGTFQMGSPENEAGRAGDETQHTVTISQPFYMSQFPITQQQYLAARNEYWIDDPSRIKAQNNPVEQIWHMDASVFCDRLNNDKQIKAHLPPNMRFQLPTEAQWEYACRAGSTSRFCSGDDDKDLGIVAWHSANSDAKTHPVGEKKPNAFGLYDMHGNVGQWCLDFYRRDYENLNSTDPFNAKGTERVFRGGSWSDQAEKCRSASRNRTAGVSKLASLGFRVVLAVPPKEQGK